MVAFNLDFFILLFLAAVIGIQIAEESVLAIWVKQFLFLMQPYKKNLLSYGKFIFWKRLIGTASFLLLPLFLIVMFVFRFHHWLSELLDCSMCTSTWIFGLLLYFYLHNNVVDSLLFAPLSIIGVYLLEKIRK